MYIGSIVICEIKRQMVPINGYMYTFLPCNIGVHQGSVLGPLFFLNINDLPRAAYHDSVNLFADYTSMYSGGGAMENLEAFIAK